MGPGGLRWLLFRIWAPEGVSRALSSATATALSLLLFDRTRSALVLSSVVGFSMLSSIYVSPLLGGFVDHFQKRHVLMVCSLAQAVLVVLLGISVASAVPGYVVLFAVVVLAGAIDSVLAITLQAVIADLAEDGTLVQANAFVSLVQGAPVVLGPAIGAALYSVTSFTFIVVLDLLSFLMAALAALQVPLAPAVKGGERWFRLPFSGARTGLRVLLGNADMRSSQLLYSLSNFGNGLPAGLLPVYVLLVSNSSTTALGAFGVASALGAVASALLLGAVRVPGRRFVLVVAGLGLAALLGRLPLVLVSSVAAVVVVGFLRSFCLGASSSPLLAIWQRATPKEVRGQVFGARRLLAQAPYPLAVWLGGLLAESAAPSSQASQLHAVVALILVGVVIELVSVVVLLLTGCLARLEQTGGEQVPAGSR